VHYSPLAIDKRCVLQLNKKNAPTTMQPRAPLNPERPEYKKLYCTDIYMPAGGKRENFSPVIDHYIILRPSPKWHTSYALTILWTYIGCSVCMIEKSRRGVSFCHFHEFTLT